MVGAGEGTGADEVGADVAAGDAVGDAGDLGLGEGLLEEVELGGARLSVLEGDGEDGAVVLGDDEGAVVAALEIGEVAVLVEDAGDDADLLVEGETGGALPRPLQAAGSAAVEDAGEEGGVLVLDVLEELVGEVDVVAGEEGVTGGGEGVEVLRATGADTAVMPAAAWKVTTACNSAPARLAPCRATSRPGFSCIVSAPCLTYQTRYSSRITNRPTEYFIRGLRFPSFLMHAFPTVEATPGA